MVRSLGLEARVELSFDEAVTRTKEGLKAEGFGVLTEIDLRGAFREKLNVEFRPYRILGACDPKLAHAAISVEPMVGLLLPCNVTVEASSDRQCTIRATDPIVLLQSAGLKLPAELQSMALQARARLERMLRTVAGNAAVD